MAEIEEPTREEQEEFWRINGRLAEARSAPGISRASFIHQSMIDGGLGTSVNKGNLLSRA